MGDEPNRGDRGSPSGRRHAVAPFSALEDVMPTGVRLRTLGILIVAGILASTAALMAAVERIARRPGDAKPVGRPR